ncbi:MAG: hypothetical protein ACKOX6_00715 [Bdellovibrio sp.]
MKSMTLLASASFAPSVPISGQELSSWDNLRQSATVLAQSIKLEQSLAIAALEMLVSGKSPALFIELKVVNGTIICHQELYDESSKLP